MVNIVGFNTGRVYRMLTEQRQYIALGYLALFRAGKIDYTQLRTMLETEEIKWATEHLDNAMEYEIDD
jgi:hypothetical protein